MKHRVAAIITLLTVALSFAFESTAHSQSLEDIKALLRSDEPNVRIAALETLENHEVRQVTRLSHSFGDSPAEILRSMSERKRFSGWQASTA